MCCEWIVRRKLNRNRIKKKRNSNEQINGSRWCFIDGAWPIWSLSWAVQSFVLIDSPQQTDDPLNRSLHVGQHVHVTIDLRSPINHRTQVFCTTGCDINRSTISSNHRTYLSSHTRIITVPNRLMPTRTKLSDDHRQWIAIHIRRIFQMKEINFVFSLSLYHFILNRLHLKKRRLCLFLFVVWCDFDCFGILWEFFERFLYIAFRLWTFLWMSFQCPRICINIIN